MIYPLSTKLSAIVAPSFRSRISGEKVSLPQAWGINTLLSTIKGGWSTCPEGAWLYYPPESFDPATQVQTTLEPVMLDGEQIGVTMGVRDKTAEELANYLADLDVQLEAQIDLAVDAKRREFVSSGDWTLLAEYDRTKEKTQAFIDAGYSGEVPAVVDAHCIRFKCTVTEAADQIMLLADLWEDVIDATRYLRFRKQDVFDATTATAKKAAATVVLTEIEAFNV